MPGFNGLAVDAPNGPRWDLALTLIETGEGTVRLGEVEITRSTAGPNPDGTIRITVTVGEGANREVAQTALSYGRRVAKQAASADPRFAQLLDRYGCRWEVGCDYGMGAIRVGEAGRQGDLIWDA